MYFEFQKDERPGGAWVPTIDVCERPDEFVIFAEMPGVDRADVHILWKNGTLIIAGQKRQHPPDQDVARYFCVERAYGRFRREISIDVLIDYSRARAELRNGLMCIHLPKAAAAPGAHRIPIL
jgi:HSP20 family protein